jgi:hypothetical protein
LDYKYQKKNNLNKTENATFDLNTRNNNFKAILFSEENENRTLLYSESAIKKR